MKTDTLPQKTEPGQGVTTEDKEEDKKTKEMRERMRTMVFLSVMYASDIGGTGVVTGTGPNLTLMQFLAR